MLLRVAGRISLCLMRAPSSLARPLGMFGTDLWDFDKNMTCRRALKGYVLHRVAWRSFQCHLRVTVSQVTFLMSLEGGGDQGPGRAYSYGFVLRVLTWDEEVLTEFYRLGRGSRLW